MTVDRLLAVLEDMAAGVTRSPTIAATEAEDLVPLARGYLPVEGPGPPIREPVSLIQGADRLFVAYGDGPSRRIVEVTFAEIVAVFRYRSLPTEPTEPR